MIVAVGVRGRVRLATGEIGKGNVRLGIGPRRQYLRDVICSSKSLDVPPQGGDVSDLERVVGGQLILRGQVEPLHIRGYVIELDASEGKPIGGHERGTEWNTQKAALQRRGLPVC